MSRIAAWPRGLTCFLLMFLPLPLLAETYTVAPDGSGDFPTIQAAIGGPIPEGSVIELLPGVFTGQGNRDVTFYGRRLVVRSRALDPNTCIVDCEGEGYGFSFVGGEEPTTVLEGITIRNGVGGRAGGAYAINSSPTIRGCVFEGNVCPVGLGGGAIYLDGSSSLIESCKFAKNELRTFVGAGAVCVGSGAATIRNCMFVDNVADVSNPPVINGPALHCQFASIVVEDCTFYGNHADPGTGAVWIGRTSAVFHRCTFAGNAGFACGAIGAYEADLVLDNCVIAMNRSSAGPVTYCDSGSDFDLSCCDVFGNEGGDWVDCLAGQEGENGNLCLDPIFCDLSLGDLTLRSDSPCGPDFNTDCGLIGAWPLGCIAPTAIAPTSWGRLKATFR
ncbi:MAG: right-handed parallel beta-helix repeat-containing protein [Candidatus Eisenbacteria bacterium]|nr:right-handed parallel beta-helix repeat-containing protein [Candidatus Eisenbacteria bacterium]